MPSQAHGERARRTRATGLERSGRRSFAPGGLLPAYRLLPRPESRKFLSRPATLPSTTKALKTKVTLPGGVEEESGEEGS